MPLSIGTNASQAAFFYSRTLLGERSAAGLQNQIFGLTNQIFGLGLQGIQQGLAQGQQGGGAPGQGGGAPGGVPRLA